MLTIEFRFTGGRYHATPWGRHVNEGAIAWPPEPWRILRALIAVWHRKALRETETVLERLVEKLAASLPIFRLPVASHSHSRHYMPVLEGKTQKRLMIFDAFLRIDRDDPLLVSWPDIVLSPDEQALLDRLLAGMAYLGRAESWVDAVRTEQALDGPSIARPVDSQSGDVAGDLIDLIAAMPALDYQEWRQATLASMLPKLGIRGKKLVDVRRTIPERLLDLLRLDTADWQGAGWSEIPGSRQITYSRPSDWDLPKRTPARNRPRPFTTARFALIGRPLPPAEDSVRVGEWMRRALMGKAKQILGEDSIPPALSGRDSTGLLDGHRHAFFLPERNRIGVIDHVLVHASGGLEAAAEPIASIRTMKGRDHEWRLVLEDAGELGAFEADSRLVQAASVWISSTPYLHPWYRKRNFGPQEQIVRELVARGEPAPVAVEPIESVRVGARRRSSLNFHRFRSRRGLVQPDTLGSFWKVTFSRPVRGPIALGYGAHYGLGLFESVPEEEMDPE